MEGNICIYMNIRAHTRGHTHGNTHKSICIHGYTQYQSTHIYVYICMHTGAHTCSQGTEKACSPSSSHLDAGWGDRPSQADKCLMGPYHKVMQLREQSAGVWGGHVPVSLCRIAQNQLRDSEKAHPAFTSWLGQGKGMVVSCMAGRAWGGKGSVRGHCTESQMLPPVPHLRSHLEMLRHYLLLEVLSGLNGVSGIKPDSIAYKASAQSAVLPTSPAHILIPDIHLVS